MKYIVRLFHAPVADTFWSSRPSFPYERGRELSDVASKAEQPNNDEKLESL